MSCDTCHQAMDEKEPYRRLSLVLDTDASTSEKPCTMEEEFPLVVCLRCAGELERWLRRPGLGEARITAIQAIVKDAEGNPHATRTGLVADAYDSGFAEGYRLGAFPLGVTTVPMTTEIDDPGSPPSEVLEAWAKDCRCCPVCWHRPCEACMAGGICDSICNCDDEDDSLRSQKEESEFVTTETNHTAFVQYEHVLPLTLDELKTVLTRFETAYSSRPTDYYKIKPRSSWLPEELRALGLAPEGEWWVWRRVPLVPPSESV